MKDLPADQRPREKLLARGAGALADAELPALLRRSGNRGHGVMALSQQVLGQAVFAGLLQATAGDLSRVKGLGPAKRRVLLAVMEMARRALAQPLQAAPVFDSPARVRDYLAPSLAGRGQEVFAVKFPDSQHRMRKLEDMFHGALTQTSVYPREVVKRALALNAAAVVLAHNTALGRGRAFARRRVPHADARGGAATGGRAGARPCRGRARPGGLEGRIWTGLSFE
jgi:DNA repair protein RadC